MHATLHVQVMRALNALLNQDDLSSEQAAAFADAQTSPAAMLRAMHSDAELAELMRDPVVVKALAHIRARPASGLATWEAHPRVARALDLLEAALAPGGAAGQPTDVEASKPQNCGGDVHVGEGKG